MSDNRPIGVFDSGVGGLTVTRALLEKLPDERIIYFGDTAHVPYGNKSREQLLNYARNIMRYLLERNVKAVMVACGTHSSITIPRISGDYDLPIIGMVKPGARAAIQNSRNGRIGICATEATIKSGSFTSRIKELAPSCQVFEMACPRFVPLIESGQLQGLETLAAVREYITPLQKHNIDTLVFGCTHYPFLTDIIAGFAGDSIGLVDPACQAVEDLSAALMAAGIRNDGNGAPPCHEFIVSGDPDSFCRVGRMLIGSVIGRVESVSLELEDVV